MSLKNIEYVFDIGPSYAACFPQILHQRPHIRRRMLTGDVGRPCQVLQSDVGVNPVALQNLATFANEGLLGRAYALQGQDVVGMGSVHAHGWWAHGVFQHPAGLGADGLGGGDAKGYPVAQTAEIGEVVANRALCVRGVNCPNYPRLDRKIRLSVLRLRLEHF